MLLLYLTLGIVFLTSAVSAAALFGQGQIVLATIACWIILASLGGIYGLVQYRLSGGAYV